MRFLPFSNYINYYNFRGHGFFTDEFLKEFSDYLRLDFRNKKQELWQRLNYKPTPMERRESFILEDYHLFDEIECIDVFIAFTISQFVKFKVHLGFLGFALSTLSVYLIRSYNLYFYNLNFTLFYFRLVLNIIMELQARRFTLLMSINKSRDNYIDLLDNFKNIQYIMGSWIPGFLTNFKVVRRNLYFFLRPNLFNFCDFKNNVYLGEKFFSSIQKEDLSFLDYIFESSYDFNEKYHLFSRRFEFLFNEFFVNNKKQNISSFFKGVKSSKIKKKFFSPKRFKYFRFLMIKFLYSFLFLFFTDLSFKKRIRFFEKQSIPSFVIFSNSSSTIFGHLECLKLGLPFSSFLDSPGPDVFYSKYFIPGNFRSQISLYFYFYLILRFLFMGSIFEKKEFRIWLKRNVSSFIFNRNFLYFFFFFRDLFLFSLNSYLSLFLLDKKSYNQNFVQFIRKKWLLNLTLLFNSFFRSSFFLFNFNFLGIFFFNKVSLTSFSLFFKSKFLYFFSRSNNFLFSFNQFKILKKKFLMFFENQFFVLFLNFMSSYYYFYIFYFLNFVFTNIYFTFFKFFIFRNFYFFNFFSAKSKKNLNLFLNKKNDLLNFFFFRYSFRFFFFLKCRSISIFVKPHKNYTLMNSKRIFFKNMLFFYGQFIPKLKKTKFVFYFDKKLFLYKNSIFSILVLQKTFLRNEIFSYVLKNYREWYDSGYFRFLRKISRVQSVSFPFFEFEKLNNLINIYTTFQN